MLAVKKVRSYQIPDDIRELIAQACDSGGTDTEEILALRKMAALFRSDAVVFTVAMAGDSFEWIGD